MTKKKNKKFTWGDLKRITNNIADRHLPDEVIIWTDRDDDAAAFIVKGVERLSEDYLRDDEGCSPRSVVVDNIEKDETFDPKDWPVVLHKGQRILYAE